LIRNKQIASHYGIAMDPSPPPDKITVALAELDQQNADSTPLGEGYVRGWSANEVALWLRGQGLSDAACAEFEAVTGSDLLICTADDITCASVTPIKARALIAKIQALGRKPKTHMWVRVNPTPTRTCASANGAHVGGESQ
jgi:hypothetical protein